MSVNKVNDSTEVSPIDNPMAPQYAFHALNRPVDAHLEQLAQGVRVRPDVRDGEQSHELALPPADWRDALPPSPDVSGPAKAKSLDLPKSSLDVAAASETPPSAMTMASMGLAVAVRDSAANQAAANSAEAQVSSVSTPPVFSSLGSPYDMVPTPLEAGIEILSGMYDIAPPSPMAPAYAGIPTALEASIEILCGMIEPPPSPDSLERQSVVPQHSPVSYPPTPPPELSPILENEGGAGTLVRGKA